MRPSVGISHRCTGIAFRAAGCCVAQTALLLRYPSKFGLASGVFFKALSPAKAASYQLHRPVLTIPRPLGCLQAKDRPE